MKGLVIKVAGFEDLIWTSLFRFLNLKTGRIQMTTYLQICSAIFSHEDSAFSIWFVHHAGCCCCCCSKNSQNWPQLGAEFSEFPRILTTDRSVKQNFQNIPEGISEVSWLYTSKIVCSRGISVTISAVSQTTPFLSLYHFSSPTRIHVKTT